MDARENAMRAIDFGRPERIPLCTTIAEDTERNRRAKEALQDELRNDFVLVMNTDQTFRPSRPNVDEWGNEWTRAAETMGEVTGHPLLDWDRFDEWKQGLPDFSNPLRYENARKVRQADPGKLVMGGLRFGMMNLLNLRGYENFMMDFYLESNRLSELIDTLYGELHRMSEGYAAAGVDAVILWEDWGLQDQLIISPAMWRDVFKSRMAELVAHVHDLGLRYVLHSCGYIIDIVPDLIDMGIDVLQLDQQRQIGLDRLGEFAGSVCFFCPADIQYMSDNRDLDAVRDYCEGLIDALSTPTGGFMYKTYAQPGSVDISIEAIEEEYRTMTRRNPYAEQGDGTAR
jgi:hypothetical protein